MRKLTISNSPDLMKEVGKFVSQARQASGMTQTQLANMAGVSRSSIAHIERGDFSATAQMLSRILDPLGFRIEISEK